MSSLHDDLQARSHLTSSFPRDYCPCRVLPMFAIRREHAGFQRRIDNLIEKYRDSLASDDEDPKRIWASCGNTAPTKS